MYNRNILSLSVHLVHTPSPVPAPQMFTYGKSSEPQSQSHEALAESITPKLKPTSRNNPSNLIPNVPDDPDSYPSSSESSLLH